MTTKNNARWYVPTNDERERWGMTLQDPRTVVVTRTGVYIYWLTESEDKVAGAATAAVLLGRLERTTQ